METGRTGKLGIGILGETERVRPVGLGWPGRVLRKNSTSLNCALLTSQHEARARASETPTEEPAGTDKEWCGRGESETGTESIWAVPIGG